MRKQRFSKTRFLILFGILTIIFIGIQFMPPQSPDSVFASKAVVTFIAVASPFYIVPLMDWLFPRVDNKKDGEK